MPETMHRAHALGKHRKLPRQSCPDCKAGRGARWKEPLYPMHEKLKGLGHDRAAVQSFIDWLFDEQDWSICEETEFERVEWERLMPVRHSRETIMAMFFEIDLKVLDDEKRVMLDRCREINAKAEA